MLTALDAARTFYKAHRYDMCFYHPSFERMELLFTNGEMVSLKIQPSIIQVMSFRPRDGDRDQEDLAGEFLSRIFNLVVAEQGILWVGEDLTMIVEIEGNRQVCVEILDSDEYRLFHAPLSQILMHGETI